MTTPSPTTQFFNVLLTDTVSVFPPGTLWALNGSNQLIPAVSPNAPVAINFAPVNFGQTPPNFSATSPHNAMPVLMATNTESIDPWLIATQADVSWGSTPSARYTTLLTELQASGLLSNTSAWTALDTAEEAA